MCDRPNGANQEEGRVVFGVALLETCGGLVDVLVVDLVESMLDAWVWRRCWPCNSRESARAFSCVRTK